jgi:PEP-CTERM motif
MQRKWEQIVNIRYSNLRFSSMGTWKRVFLAGAAAAATLLGSGMMREADASNIILENGNSQVTINPTATAGLQDWLVNGTNQLNQEWFWYRTGSSGGQSSLNSLGLTNSAEYDTTGDSLNDTAILTYGTSSSLQVQVVYSLVGGMTGSDNSDLGETIMVANNTKSTQTYHFFAYANFNLGDSTSDQTVDITGGNTATVKGPGMEAQTVVGPMPSEFQAADSPTLLNDVASSSTYQLNDVATAAAGDPEWAFEWDLTLTAGNSAVLSIDHNLTQQTIAAVPEPAAGSLALLGFGSALLSRRRRSGSLVVPKRI